jgi:hypothetical protein
MRNRIIRVEEPSKGYHSGVCLSGIGACIASALQCLFQEATVAPVRRGFRKATQGTFTTCFFDLVTIGTSLLIF